MQSKASYRKAGVDIDTANATKTELKTLLETSDKRVLNKVGAFASLIELPLVQYKQPVLVLKMEEPGSKQKLAFAYNRVESLCHDLINHLTNDVMVMGADPIAVLDVIICGKLEKNIVKQLVASMAQACKKQGCLLVGGETSEQPKVLDKGNYILAASMVGLVEKDHIIDGSKIEVNDVVLSLPSNGPHTNGYSLIRSLIDNNPSLVNKKIAGETFLELIMQPHTAYYHQLKPLFNHPALHGIAHITGGGIKENLNRILPQGLNAVIDLSEFHIPPIFKVIKEVGNITNKEMLRTFNLGVGMTLVVKDKSVSSIQEKIMRSGGSSYIIGKIIKGRQKVICKNSLQWS